MKGQPSASYPLLSFIFVKLSFPQSIMNIQLQCLCYLHCSNGAWFLVNF